MVNSILVPTPALLALGGRPGGIPRAASQHSVQNMSVVDYNIPICLSFE